MMNLLLKLVTSVLRSEKHPRHASREIARLNAFRVQEFIFYLRWFGIAVFFRTLSFISHARKKFLSA